MEECEADNLSKVIFGIVKRQKYAPVDDEEEWWNEVWNLKPSSRQEKTLKGVVYTMFRERKNRMAQEFRKIFLDVMDIHRPPTRRDDGRQILLQDTEDASSQALLLGLAPAIEQPTRYVTWRTDASSNTTGNRTAALRRLRHSSDAASWESEVTNDKGKMEWVMHPKYLEYIERCARKVHVPEKILKVSHTNLWRRFIQMKFESYAGDK